MAASPVGPILPRGMKAWPLSQRARRTHTTTLRLVEVHLRPACWLAGLEVICLVLAAVGSFTHSAGPRLQLRSGRPSAAEFEGCPWEVITGPGRFSKMYYEEPIFADEEGKGEPQLLIELREQLQAAGASAADIARAADEFRAQQERQNPGTMLLGTETNFTVFRNSATGVAVELADDYDVPGLTGFFRMLSADMFDVLPDTMAQSGGSLDCPGHVCYVNGHFTGDFLVGKQMYNLLKSTPGQRLFSTQAMELAHWHVSAMEAGEGTEGRGAGLWPGNVDAALELWETMPSRDGGGALADRMEVDRAGWEEGREEVWSQRRGNWTLVREDVCLVLRHRAYAARAQLVLTPRGMVYTGTSARSASRPFLSPARSLPTAQSAQRSCFPVRCYALLVPSPLFALPLLRARRVVEGEYDISTHMLLSCCLVRHSYIRERRVCRASCVLAACAFSLSVHMHVGRIRPVRASSEPSVHQALRRMF